MAKFQAKMDKFQAKVAKVAENPAMGTFQSDLRPFFNFLEQSSLKPTKMSQSRTLKVKGSPDWLLI